MRRSLTSIESSEVPTDQQSSLTGHSGAANSTGSQRAATPARRKDVSNYNPVQTRTPSLNSVPKDTFSTSVHVHVHPSASTSGRPRIGTSSMPPAFSNSHPSPLDTNDVPGIGRPSIPSLPVDPTTHSLPRIPTLQLAASVHSLPPDGVRDDPGYDFYTETVWYKFFVGFVIFEMWIFTLYIVPMYGVLVGAQFVFILIPYKQFLWMWPPIWMLVSLMLFVLNSLMIETFRKSPSQWLTPRLKEKMAKILLMFSGMNIFLCQCLSLLTPLLQEFDFDVISISGYVLLAEISFYFCCSITCWSYAKISAMISRG